MLGAPVNEVLEVLNEKKKREAGALASVDPVRSPFTPVLHTDLQADDVGSPRERQFPVTENEDWFLSLNYSADWMILKARFQLENPNILQLRRAWEQLCYRHEALMSVYRVHGNVWKRHLPSKPPPLIEEQFDREFDFYNFLSVQGRDILSYVDPLCRCYAIKMPKAGSLEVVILCHHVTLDLLALNAIVVPELIALYGNQSLVAPGMSLSQLVSYKDCTISREPTKSPPWHIPLTRIQLISPRGNLYTIRDTTPTISDSLVKQFLRGHGLKVSKVAVICYALLVTCMKRTGQRSGYVSLMHHGRDQRKYTDPRGNSTTFSLWRTVTNAFRAKKAIISLTGEHFYDSNDTINENIKHVETEIKSTRREIDSPEECFLINYHARNAHSNEMADFQKLGWHRKEIDFNLKTFVPSSLNSQSLVVEEGAGGDLFFSWSFHPGVSPTSCDQFVDDVRRSLGNLNLLAVQEERDRINKKLLSNGKTDAVSVATASRDKILLFCCHPLVSRMSQILPLVNFITASTDMKCIVVSSKEFQSPIEQAGAIFWPVQETDKGLVKPGDGSIQWKPEHFALWMIRQAVKYLPLLVDQMAKTLLRSATDATYNDVMMFCDSSFWAGLFAAEIFSVPCTLLHMGLAINDSFSWISFDFDANSAEDEILQYYINLLVKRHGVHRGTKITDLWPTPRAAKRAVAFIAYNFQPQNISFDQTKTFFFGPSIFHGPFRPMAEMASQVSLPDDTKPVVLISLGTICNQNEQFYRSCMQFLKPLTQFTFVMAIGKEADPSRLGDVPDNFFIFPFVDQRAILQQASLFITHGGVNSCQESLFFGVPMVVVPQHFDQHLVANRVQELGLGVHFANDETLMAGLPETVLRVTALGSSYRKETKKYMEFLQSHRPWTKFLDFVFSP